MEQERALLRELSARKEAMEHELEALAECLTAGNGPGLHGNLVDRQVGMIACLLATFTCDRRGAYFRRHQKIAVMSASMFCSAAKGRSAGFLELSCFSTSQLVLSFFDCNCPTWEALLFEAACFERAHAHAHVCNQVLKKRLPYNGNNLAASSLASVLITGVIAA
eukprot:1159402-Pelagomonas_calceolata.AAC.4